jgi:photosystem II stability/assembly factor-like uncharacterized protein
MARSFCLALSVAALAGCLDFSKFDNPPPGSPATTMSFQTESYGRDKLLGTWGSSPRDLYIVGATATLAHSTDGGHTFIDEGVGTDLDLYAVWGSGAGDVWVVGANGIVRHSDEGGWGARELSPDSNKPILSSLYGVWGSGPSDIFVVGAGGLVYHSTDGMSWTQEAQGMVTDDLVGIWGTGGQIFAVGASGALLASSDGGATWKTSTIAADRLHAIWGSGPNDLYAGGDAAIYHSTDGATWSATPVAAPIYALTGASATDVFAVGDGGLILHHGTSDSWSRLDAPTSAALHTVWEGAPGTLVAAGTVGTIVTSK